LLCRDIPDDPIVDPGVAVDEDVAERDDPLVLGDSGHGARVFLG